ncbi:MAG: hypothetical protein HGA85_03715 [Nanoarchaeota archaeon]|nr:hypothetical protein [Nanoarchaeota archaeon]
MTNSESSFDQEKFCCILAWFFPFGLLWWYLDENMKKNRHVKFQVKQSLTLVAFFIVYSFVSLIATQVTGILTIIPVLGQMIQLAVGFVLLVIGLALFALWAIGLITIIQEKEQELFLIGKYAVWFRF